MPGGSYGHDATGGVGKSVPLLSATRVAAVVGHIFAVAFMLIGFWLVFIGGFLLQAGLAQSARAPQ